MSGHGDSKKVVVAALAGNLAIAASAPSSVCNTPSLSTFVAASALSARFAGRGAVLAAAPEVKGSGFLPSFFAAAAKLARASGWPLGLVLRVDMENSCARMVLERKNLSAAHLFQRPARAFSSEAGVQPAGRKMSECRTSARRLFEEKPDKFSRGIRAFGVRIRACFAATGPSMAGAINHPAFKDRIAILACNHCFAEATTVD